MATATKTKTIRVSINADVAHLLEAMKEEYPALNYAEILKLGLSELYRKHELEKRQAWIDSLPTLELNEEQQAELDEAMREAKEEMAKGNIRSMTVDEIMAQLEE